MQLRRHILALIVIALSAAGVRAEIVGFKPKNSSLQRTTTTTYDFSASDTRKLDAATACAESIAGKVTYKHDVTYSSTLTYAVTYDIKRTIKVEVPVAATDSTDATTATVDSLYTNKISFEVTVSQSGSWGIEQSAIIEKSISSRSLKLVKATAARKDSLFLSKQKEIAADIANPESSLYKMLVRTRRLTFADTTGKTLTLPKALNGKSATYRRRNN